MELLTLKLNNMKHFQLFIITICITILLTVVSAISVLAEYIIFSKYVSVITCLSGCICIVIYLLYNEEEN